MRPEDATSYTLQGGKVVPQSKDSIRFSDFRDDIKPRGIEVRPVQQCLYFEMASKDYIDKIVPSSHEEDVRQTTQRIETVG